MPTDPDSDRRRITYTADGPALVEGPVELVTADGRTIRSDRCVVALCLCRRSALYPLCDTSHRKRRRAREQPR
ncbi:MULTISPECIES: CDGSH iron-sulfur domain-containing protein [Nocardia]|uniref:CDGSH iron-sulfur domain-containing protein n=1 Tax=Nocardia otitidiscaviarum TaxID=1823 RepID=A0A516NHE5_9NOCA|nr:MULTISPECIES: CDGSH iron-sulfur domain-containing protein [Nocardia]MBF6177590.1 CDGSH iron-sulfur domain-containing protein [Nocardia otitidiscaviarum]MCP9625090.1 CDGSH iron-sulfur domain-containing protein [Nocardia otitidiscaviarum]QDP78331.1 CDGSH iron-sulfur domain-containing protein [Nocardia otitidiscaviarum]